MRDATLDDFNPYEAPRVPERPPSLNGVVATISRWLATLGLIGAALALGGSSAMFFVEANRAHVAMTRRGYHITTVVTSSLGPAVALASLTLICLLLIGKVWRSPKSPS